MDLNKANLLVYGKEHMSNCGKEDNFGDTTLCLNSFALGVSNTTGVGDSCSQAVPPHDDPCMLCLGLGCNPSLHGSNHSFAAASISNDPVACLKHGSGENVDSGMLQLGLSWEAGEPVKNTEQSDRNVASANNYLYHNGKNNFHSVVDEGSTNGGGFVPSHLSTPSLGRAHSSEGKPDIVASQDCQHHSPDPSATTDCSVASLMDPTDENTVHHSHGRVHHPKKCRFKGCLKGARGASGLCIAHGGGQRCQKPGCNKGAESRTAFCKAHGGGRRCQTLGCTKSAEGKTDFCIAHGGGRRCNHEGCTKAARGKSGFCIRHGGGKRCSVEGCTRSAEGQAGLCISHGGGRRCQHLGCTKGAQGSTMYCKAHGGGRRCIFEGCTKGAEGSTSLCKAHGGGKRCLHEGCTKSVHGGTDYCVAHGGGKRCAVPGCTKSARGRTDFCVKHGGGKRCKHEGCGKSAQGSTDFCKAHGGGKRCSWPEGCDKFARGKNGLCAGHANKSTAAQRGCGLWNAPAATFPVLASAGSMDEDDSSGVSTSLESRGKIPLQIPHVFVPLSMKTPLSLTAEGETSCAEHKSCDGGFVVPEGRVHGGGLLLLLGGSFHSADVGSDGLV